MIQDSLGERIKEQYENRTRYLLPRRTYTVIRVDGKAFHSYTAKLQRPFDTELSNSMDRTAISLCQNMQGAQIGFVQSDEISIVLTDFETIQTEAWFNGNLQKIVSVSASMATAAFNQSFQHVKDTPATFDARAFTIPDREEVLNYLIWRQKDATRNSIQQAAQSMYSHAELHGKNNQQLHQLMYEKGVNWDDFQPRYKRGAAIIRMPGPGGCVSPPSLTWQADQNTPIFTQERSYLEAVIPKIGGENTTVVNAAESVQVIFSERCC